MAPSSSGLPARPGERVHVVGVCGIGMSAVAQLLAGGGWAVSGSDRRIDRGDRGRVAQALEAMGVRLTPQDGRGVDDTTRCVVISSAIEEDNPDRAAARRRGIPVRHRSACLAGLLQDRRTVGVTGTSGKSTVTAMIGWVLAACGADPQVVNGAICPAWRAPDRVGNVRFGAGALCVFEADESDRTLGAYTPDWAVVTNVSHDHFGVAEAAALFGAFCERAREGVVDGVHEPVAAGRRYAVPMPGRHNMENAAVAGALCERLGYAPDAIAKALATFPGLHRRLERVGDAAGVTVFDDYAHNPAKIRAAWDAVRPAGGRVLGVWRPHGFGPLRQMKDALAATFRDVCGGGDRVYLLPVYDAGGTAERSIGVEVLAGAVPAAAVVDAEAVAATVALEARAGDTVLVMGARDPDLPALARRILRAMETGRAGQACMVSLPPGYRTERDRGGPA